ncbi:MAG: RNA methyltransferase [Acidimicrobiia bacterium]|nr:RNA methyltransferase [Acidimicrobiia bacterium]
MAHAGIGAEVEGIHAVAAALDAGRIERLLVEKGRLSRSDVGAIADRARAEGVEVVVVADVRPSAVTTAPQGLVAQCRPIPSRKLKPTVTRMENPALLVLDRVQDPRNIGAAARSAWAAGMTGIVVADRRGAPIGATAFKASVGALEHVPVMLVSSIAEALGTLSRMDVWTVGLSGSTDRSIFGLDLLDQPVALCIGAEGSGLSQLVAERCDVIAGVPMPGGAESLNASVAAAIACYEVARVRGWVS